MALVIESDTFSRNTADSTTLVVTMPSTRPDADLYIFIGGLHGDTGWGSIPAHWTEIVTDSHATQVRSTAYSWLGDSEPTSYTLTQNSEESWGVVYRITGHGLENPINVSGSDSGNETNTPSVSVTTTLDNCLVLAMATVYSRRVNSVPATEDAGGATSDVELDFNQVGYGLYHFTQVTAGATPIGNFTNSVAGTAALTVAIGPNTAVPSDERGYTFFGI